MTSVRPTKTYIAPGSVISADPMPVLCRDWLDTVADERVWTDSILTAMASRKGANGRKVRRLYLLCKLLALHLTKVHGIKLGTYLPLDYVIAALKPIMGANHMAVWKLAAKWGIVHTFERQNGLIVPAHDKLSKVVMEKVFKFTEDDMAEPGSVANLLWVSHCEIRQRAGLLFQKKWTYKTENAYAASLFTQALNAFGFEWSRELFAKVLNLHPDTLTAYSKATREIVKKRAILVGDFPKSKKARGKLHKKAGTFVKKGSVYFNHIDKATGKESLARYIPSIYTNRLKKDRVKVRHSYSNLVWGRRLSKLDSVHDVIVRARKAGMNREKISRLVRKYHARRARVQRAEIRSRDLSPNDRTLYLAAINDNRLHQKMRSGADRARYPIGDGKGEVIFPTKMMTRQARNKGLTLRPTSGVESLYWSNSPSRRPMKCVRHKCASTLDVTVGMTSFGPKKVAAYKVTKQIRNEIKALGFKPKGRQKVVTLERGVLKDMHNRRKGSIRRSA